MKNTFTVMFRVLSLSKHVVFFILKLLCSYRMQFIEEGGVMQSERGKEHLPVFAKTKDNSKPFLLLSN